MQSITYANNNKVWNNEDNNDNFLIHNNKYSKFNKDLKYNKNKRNYYIIDK